jgi:hypothetical protein
LKKLTLQEEEGMLMFEPQFFSTQKIMVKEKTCKFWPRNFEGEVSGHKRYTYKVGIWKKLVE